MSCAQHDEFKFDARCTCSVTITINRPTVEFWGSLPLNERDARVDDIIYACRAALKETE